MTSGGRRRIATWVHRASSPQPHAAAGGRKKRTGSARSLQGALPPASPARPGRYSRVILKCNNEVKPTGRHRHRHRHPARFYLHPLYLRFAAEKPRPALDPSPSRVSDVHVESFLLFFHLPCGHTTNSLHSLPLFPFVTVSSNAKHVKREWLVLVFSFSLSLAGLAERPACVPTLAHQALVT